MTLQATLITDGSSDTVLMPILRWVLGVLTSEPVELRWGDLRGLAAPPRSLRARLTCAVELYPCRLLFVHRDAERQPAEERHVEVEEANTTGISHVCVVPVRMQEAWLLLDEAALREAAGRPSGKQPLGLPPPSRWETLPDPKRILHAALMAASEATGRRANKFNAGAAAHRLADLVSDWSPLRQLSAFRRLEHDTRDILGALGLPVYPATS